jgi:acyl carrier protein phosphodiesterase
LNYLAHIFLSGKDSGLQIGNFIGDFVKGSQFNDFPEGIRNGIILHRKIDHFTDNHEIVKETIAFLRPNFGRYSGIISDMYFDYFLAINFSKYSGGKSLNQFAYRFYFYVLIKYKYLPDRVKSFIFHFIFTNRLSSYSSLDGLKNSLEIMSRHKVKAIHPQKTIDFLIENQTYLEQQFHLFFPDLIEFVKKKII